MISLVLSLFAFGLGVIVGAASAHRVREGQAHARRELRAALSPVVEASAESGYPADFVPRDLYREGR